MNMKAALTTREIEVAQMVAEGRSYKGIARDLGISPVTVKYHVENAAAKIGGPTRSPKMRCVLFVVNLMLDGASA